MFNLLLNRSIESLNIILSLVFIITLIRLELSGLNANQRRALLLCLMKATFCFFIIYLLIINNVDLKLQIAINLISTLVLSLICRELNEIKKIK